MPRSLVHYVFFFLRIISLCLPRTPWQNGFVRFWFCIIFNWEFPVERNSLGFSIICISKRNVLPNSNPRLWELAATPAVAMCNVIDWKSRYWIPFRPHWPHFCMIRTTQMAFLCWNNFVLASARHFHSSTWARPLSIFNDEQKKCFFFYHNSGIDLLKHISFWLAFNGSSSAISTKHIITLARLKCRQTIYIEIVYCLLMWTYNIDYGLRLQ